MYQLHIYWRVSNRTGGSCVVLAGAAAWRRCAGACGGHLLAVEMRCARHTLRFLAQQPRRGTGALLVLPLGNDCFAPCDGSGNAHCSRTTSSVGRVCIAADSAVPWARREAGLLAAGAHLHCGYRLRCMDMVSGSRLSTPRTCRQAYRLRAVGHAQAADHDGCRLGNCWRVNEYLVEGCVRALRRASLSCAGGRRGLAEGTVGGERHVSG
jgi:hypothetical protein